jgi:hypothetical protein
VWGSSLSRRRTTTWNTWGCGLSSQDQFPRPQLHIVIFGPQTSGASKLCRCNLQRSRTPSFPLSGLTGLPFSLIPFCKQLSTIRLHPSRPRHRILPVSRPSMWRSSISRGVSVNYGLKSICWPEWNLFKIARQGERGSRIINRNDQNFGDDLIGQGKSDYLFRASQACPMPCYFL